MLVTSLKSVEYRVDFSWVVFSLVNRDLVRESKRDDGQIGRAHV